MTLTAAKDCHTLGQQGKLGLTKKGEQRAEGFEGCISTLKAMSIIATVPEDRRSATQRQRADRFEEFGCGACHIIPGIRGAAGLVGPPLIHWSQRGYIAGEIPNNGPNLVRWIVDPRAIEPKTDMPDLGISESQARDIAAYLFSIH